MTRSIYFFPLRLVGPLGLVIGATSLSALEPLMTDLRLYGGGGMRSYTADGTSGSFDRSLDVGIQFAWSTEELSPQGSWFYGFQGEFSDREDESTSFTLNSLVASVMIGYAASPVGYDYFHAEIGAIGGLGAAVTRTIPGDMVAPVIEAGLRGGLYVTWSTMQIGLDLGYQLGATAVKVAGGSTKPLITRGFTSALSFGLRIE